MDCVNIGRQRGDLVGLQLTDEMNLETLPHLQGQSGNLGRRLLVTVLPDVRHTQLTKRLDVRAREELRDHDERNVVGQATYGPACRPDALLDVVKIGGQFLLSL